MPEHTGSFGTSPSVISHVKFEPWGSPERIVTDFELAAANTLKDIFSPISLDHCCHGRILGRWTQKWPSKITGGLGNNDQESGPIPNFLIAA
jgi:hypothetical protein